MTIATYVVQSEIGRYELWEQRVPTPGDEGAILQVEACGICGSEVELLGGKQLPFSLPIAPGHEVVGRIDSIGETARHQWGVDPGERVVVMSALRCGRCRGCVYGRRCECLESGEAGAYGWRDPSIPPGLWGGFATHMYLAPGSVVVPMATDVPLAAAVLFNPLANGIEWTTQIGAVATMDRVVVLGCGPQGLACLVAARQAGAAQIVVTGVDGDGQRLAMARVLGATTALDVTGEDPVELVRPVLDADPDLIIDTTPAPEALATGVRLLRPGGSLVLGGFKRGDVRFTEEETSALVSRGLRVVGARSKGTKSLRRAVEMIEADPGRLQAMSTDAFSLLDAQHAVELFGGLRDGTRRPHVRIEP